MSYIFGVYSVVLPGEVLDAFSGLLNLENPFFNFFFFFRTLRSFWCPFSMSVLPLKAFDWEPLNDFIQIKVVERIACQRVQNLFDSHYFRQIPYNFTDIVPAFLWFQKLHAKMRYFDKVTTVFWTMVKNILEMIQNLVFDHEVVACRSDDSWTYVVFLNYI